MGELNLLPYTLRRKQISSEKKKKYFMIIFLAVIAFALAFLIPLFIYFSYENRDSATQDKLTQMQVMYSKNKKLENAIKVDNMYLKSVDLMTKEKYSTKDNVTLFQSFMTKDIYFKSFSYNRQGVQINGYAKNYSSPEEFTANMQLSGKFTTVKLTSLNVTNDGVDFIVSITY